MIRQKLKQIALEAHFGTVRDAAMDRITKTSVLMDLVMMRIPEAIYRIDDQNLLKEIVLDETDCALIAVRKISDPAILITIIGSDARIDVIKEAIMQVQNLDMLKKAYYDSIRPDVKDALWKRLTIAEAFQNVKVWTDADKAERLKNVSNEESHKIQRAEIEEISDKSALIDIYLHARSPWICFVAKERWLKLQPNQQELVQLVLQNKIPIYDMKSIISKMQKNGLTEIIQNIEVNTDDDERTVWLVLDRLKSFREVLFEIYEDAEKNSIIRELAWTLLVKHHRKYLAGKGMQEKADKTAADLRESEQSWRKHLDDVSAAIERYN